MWGLPCSALWSVARASPGRANARNATNELFVWVVRTTGRTIPIVPLINAIGANRVKGVSKHDIDNMINQYGAMHSPWPSNQIGASATESVASKATSCTDHRRLGEDKNFRRTVSYHPNQACSAEHASAWRARESSLPSCATHWPDVCHS